MTEFPIDRVERRKREIREALNETSAALSNRIYLLNGAILGSIWAFAIGDQLPVNALSVTSVSLSLLAVISDLAQMWAGYLDQRRLHSALANAAREHAATKPPERRLRRWRMTLFDIKLGLTVLSGLIFLLSCFVMLSDGFRQ